nr:uncharacterized protein LOC100663583 isoform X2 [Loxodonta africana]
MDASTDAVVLLDTPLTFGHTPVTLWISTSQPLTQRPNQELVSNRSLFPQGSTDSPSQLMELLLHLSSSEDQCHTPRESDPPRGTLVPEPKERSLWKSSRPATEDQEETLCEEDRKDAAMKEKQPEEEMELDSQVVSSPAADFLAEDFCERKRNNHPGMGHGSTEIS